MSLTIIAAVSLNGVIGDSRRKFLPWKVPEEMNFFKENTMGKTIVMGKTTAKGVGKLPGRNCLVLSRDPDYRLDGFRTITTEQLLTMNEHSFDTPYMICGGASVYQELMPYASMAIISYMDFEAVGDVRMPTLSRDIWKKMHSIEFNRFTVVNYINTDRKIYIRDKVSQ